MCSVGAALSFAFVRTGTLEEHHCGACVRAGSIAYYLDEFAFRFNRQTSRSRGLHFYRLLEQSVVTKLVTYPDNVDLPKK